MSATVFAGTFDRKNAVYLISSVFVPIFLVAAVEESSHILKVYPPAGTAVIVRSSVLLIVNGSVYVTGVSIPGSCQVNDPAPAGLDARVIVALFAVAFERKYAVYPVSVAFIPTFRVAAVEESLHIVKV